MEGMAGVATFRAGAEERQWPRGATKIARPALPSEIPKSGGWHGTGGGGGDGSGNPFSHTPGL